MATPMIEAGAEQSNGSRRALGRKIVRYAAGSIIATGCSEATFLILFGPLHAATTLASVLGWLAGAVPNYWLNRSWTWQQRGRPNLLRELVPYVAIVILTLLLAVLATSVVDGALVDQSVSHATRTVLVGGTFLAVYGVVFLLRFFLLEQLFGRTAAAGGSSAQVPAEERA